MADLHHRHIFASHTQTKNAEFNVLQLVFHFYIESLPLKKVREIEEWNAAVSGFR